MLPLIEIDVPDRPGRECLDDYLARGWFRNGYYMAAAPAVMMDGDLFPTLQIRSRLDRFRPGKSLRRVLRRGSDRFRVEIGPARSDAARERLYELGARRFYGYMMESLEEILEAEPFEELFETQEVAVYDGDRLVGLSLFDEGRHSVSSLLGLYDPEYASFGLGMFTMLVEIEHGIGEGRRYYYPGFTTIGHERLRYKLRLDALQYLDGGGRWRALDRAPTTNRLRQRIVRRLDDLERALSRRGLPTRRRAYPHYLFAPLGIVAADLVEAPVFFECDPSEGEPRGRIVEYLVGEDAYLVADVRHCRELAELLDARLSEEGRHPVYVREPLERADALWIGESAREAAEVATGPG